MSPQGLTASFDIDNKTDEELNAIRELINSKIGRPKLSIQDLDVASISFEDLQKLQKTLAVHIGKFQK